MSKEKTEQLILEVEKTIFFDKFRHDYRQGVASPTQPGGGAKLRIPSYAIYVHHYY